MIRIKKFFLHFLFLIYIAFPLISKADNQELNHLYSRLESLKESIIMYSYLEDELSNLSKNINDISTTDIKKLIDLSQTISDYIKLEINTDPNDKAYRDGLNRLINNYKDILNKNIDSRKEKEPSNKEGQQSNYFGMRSSEQPIEIRSQLRRRGHRSGGSSEQPIAIFHAFNQHYRYVKQFVCNLANKGYSHVQISPAQKSNPSIGWWARYQPVDYGVIEGRGSENDLRDLINKALDCNVKVIADVVFNHMADFADCSDLRCFPGLSPEDFHSKCEINYGDNNRSSEMDCWLETLPDLIHNDRVRTIQKAHLKKLLDLGIGGFRFDAAKHMPEEVVRDYIEYVNRESNGNTWNYLEVIEDNDTKAEDYNGIAAVTDFILYHSMKNAFSFGGDLRSLRVPSAVNDPRSVTFGRNHDTIWELNPQYAINPYDDPTDSYLATAYVLARERGTPLIFEQDDPPYFTLYRVRYINHGVKFRQIMRQRGDAGSNVREFVLPAIDSPTVLLMERGREGFFVVNKAREKYDIPALDLTSSSLEGCYLELRNRFTVAVERGDDGSKYVTRWGTPSRGGMEVQGRDALYFIRVGDRCGG